MTIPYYTSLEDKKHALMPKAGLNNHNRAFGTQKGPQGKSGTRDGKMGREDQN